MTLNLWNYHPPWPKRRQMIAELLLSIQPDVVALQETRHDWRFERGKGQGEQLAELTGYHATSAVAQVYMPFLRVDEGLSILTRDVPLEVRKRELTLLPHERQDENHRICLGVTVDYQGKQVDVYDTHFSLSDRARLSNAREVSRFVRECSETRPAVLMGDLNALPDTMPIRFLKGEGSVDGESGDFVDLWDAANPGKTGYTYASWEPDHRIDYILGRNFPRGPEAVRVVGETPSDGVYLSDHLGVVLDISL